MRKTIYSRQGSSHLGERGRRKKRKPLTPEQLRELIQKNKDEEIKKDIKQTMRPKEYCHYSVQISDLVMKINVLRSLL